MSNVFGIKPAEIPWILCGPGFSPDRTADSLASTAKTLTLGLFFFKVCEIPETVPPVPTPATKASRPSFPKASTISCPVVLSWTSGLAGFSN